MIRDEKGEHLISEEVFTKLFLIGEFKDQDYENIVLRFLENNDKDKKLGSIKDQDKLNAFKRVLSNFFVNLEEKVNEQIKCLNLAHEKARDTYIESFKAYETISKCKIQRICGLAKGTAGKHKEHFIDNGTRGVQIISFLKWLKVYSPKQYELFKQNYTKKGGVKPPLVF